MKIKILIKSFNVKALLNLKDKILQKGYILNMPINGITLPVNKKLYTTLKSPHVNKTAREQFLLNTYKYLLILNFSKNSNLIDNIKLKFFLNFIKSISSNVQIKVQYIK